MKSRMSGSGVVLVKWWSEGACVDDNLEAVEMRRDRSEAMGVRWRQAN